MKIKHKELTKVQILLNFLKFNFKKSKKNSVNKILWLQLLADKTIKKNKKFKMKIFNRLIDNISQTYNKINKILRNKIKIVLKIKKIIIFLIKIK